MVVCPNCGNQFNNRLTLIVLGIVLVLLASMNVLEHYNYLNNPKVGMSCDCSTNVTFTALPSSPIVHNNIQASHSYTDFISKLNGLTCMRVDDMGSLSGSSMQPTFFEGNTVLSKNYTNNTILHTGDIIRYFRFNELYPDCTALQDARANNSLGGAWINNSMATIHRINAIYDDEILTQGDNLYSFETIHKCQISSVALGVIYT